jgi:hypothetical protein
MSDEIHVTARVSDPELVAALQAASDETGSKSEAIRLALREAYLGDVDDDGVNDTGLPVKAREAHGKLVELAGVGGRLELDTAEALLANHLNIAKEAVRRTVIHELKKANAIAVHQGIHSVSVVVGRLDGEDVEPRESATTSAAPATDGGKARERLEELSNAEVAR